MFKRILLCVTVVVGLAIAGGASEAKAGGCYRGGHYGGHGGGYPRTARYYGGPHYHAGPRYHHGHGASVYRRSYYGARPGYYGGYRSGVSLSFGW
jgi:hypothetical protein